MVMEIYMPKNGINMEKGTIIKWLKNVGDKIERVDKFSEETAKRDVFGYVL